MNAGPSEMHVPLTHGSLKHGFILVSQFEPVLPIGHSHEYPESVSLHVPPASHGSVVQILLSQLMPEMGFWEIL